MLYPLDEARDAPLAPEQEWKIEGRELRAAYRRALLALPRRTRRIFLMHRLKGMTYREIAEELNLGDKGVEYHMMRALVRCRQTIAFQRK
jgi:RNA polymerase sigma-70 factor (ECF subfamily)